MTSHLLLCNAGQEGAIHESAGRGNRIGTATPGRKVWEDKDGTVVKYNLVYINPIVCRVDNGRVLGYDNNHDQHHRHFMGDVEPVDFKGYEPLLKRFRAELKKLWRKENEGDS